MTSRAASWVGWLAALLAEELAPRPRRFANALRWTLIATAGAGLMAAAHVRSALGPYIVWLMVGPVAMMSPPTAVIYTAATGLIVAAAVPLAGILAESPWLMLPFIAVFAGVSTHLIATRKPGPIGVVWQVITLDSFYGVVFAPRDYGWTDAATFGGCAIALALIAAFDSWIWPDPAEAILLESLAASLKRQHARFVQAAAWYLDEAGAARPPEPPVTSEMPVQLGLLERAVEEGAGAHRRAVLLAAITSVERLHIQVASLMITARERVPHGVRAMVRGELRAACAAIAAAMDALARQIIIEIPTGADSPPLPVVQAIKPAMDALQARTLAARTAYLRTASGAEVANFGAFLEALEKIVRLIERPLDEPPPRPQPVRQAPPVIQPDPALMPYCLKVSLCVVMAYVIGLITQRADLTTILTTVIVTALPTYGASMRKMILRIVGAVLGGAISLLAIIIAAPNFESLPSYMMVTFVVLFISGYAALSSGRVAYAGKQLGTTFLLVFAGLGPFADIYSPLWRTWGILLGTLVVTVVFLVLWPVYSGDSLLPRLRRVIGDTLALTPGGSAATVAEIHRINDRLTQVLSEILQVAEDARLEGRRSLIDHDAVVQAAGTIRRIAHRLAPLAVDRMTDPLPELDQAAELAQRETFAAIRARLESWLELYQSGGALRAQAARALASRHSREEITRPLERFTNQIEEREFARIGAWTPEQRRRMLAELQSLRRLDFLMSELQTHLAAIAGAPQPAYAPYPAAVAASHPAR